MLQLIKSNRLLGSWDPATLVIIVVVLENGECFLWKKRVKNKMMQDCM